jgi:NADH pyrophosphatase NudC (nudix superfamily)
MIDYCHKDKQVSGLTALFQVGDAIMDIPSEDVVEVKHGYWIKASCSEKDGDANCSECNHWDWSDCKYCSECGAKMGDRDGEVHLSTDGKRKDGEYNEG